MVNTSFKFLVGFFFVKCVNWPLHTTKKDAVYDAVYENAFTKKNKMRLSDRENIPHFHFLLIVDAVISGLVFSCKVPRHSYY